MPSTNGSVDGTSGNNGAPTINPDKAIARLLYAMLKQKNLKDIDWNKVASDPVLLEEISNGHAARMRYSRYRNSTENSVKAAADPGSGPKPKSKASKPRRDSKKSAKRARDQDQDEDVDADADADAVANEDKTKASIKADAIASAPGDTESRDNGPSLDLDLNLDGAQPDTFLEDTEKALEDLTNSSFKSSLPSPPTDLYPSMGDASALFDRRKKMRKMYTFSPSMKAQTLHQIPLPRGAMSQASMSAMRVHSLPILSTSAAATSPSPVNLSGAQMMRHRSAGSQAPELHTFQHNNHHHHHHQQQQPQMLRQTRLMTPSSDVDHHPSIPAAHQHHTQLSLPADAPICGLDMTFDFAFANNSCNANDGSTNGHPSPWIATPFSSPPVPTFDMSPYTTLDMMGGGMGGLDHDSQPLPSLFQTHLDSQQQQQQQQDTFMAHAFAKHGSWDAMLSQGSNMHINQNL